MTCSIGCNELSEGINRSPTHKFWRTDRVEKIVYIVEGIVEKGNGVTGVAITPAQVSPNSLTQAREHPRTASGRHSP